MSFLNSDTNFYTNNYPGFPEQILKLELFCEFGLILKVYMCIQHSCIFFYNYHIIFLFYSMGVVLISRKCGSAAAHLKFGHSHGHGHSHSHGHSHNSLSVNGDRPEIAYQPLLSPSSQEDLTERVDEELAEGPIPKHENINIRAAFIHVIGDIIQSVGVLIASLIIKFTVSNHQCLDISLNFFHF